MFTLKSLSPSRASLSIPSPGGRSNPSTPNRSNPASPSTSPIGRSPSSESGYFPTVTTPAGRITKSRPIGKEEAFKTVKNLEDVLNAWNEYRLAIANVGKAGRKLAGALKDLASGGGGGGEKIDLASQTIRPTANISKPSISTSTTSSTSTIPDAPQGRRPIPSGLVVTPNDSESPKGPRNRDRTREAERPISRYEDARPVAAANSPERARPAPIPIQGYNSRRSVSNMVNELQSRQPDEGYYKQPLPHLYQPQHQVSNRSFSSYYTDPRERSFQHHQNHQTFIRGCELCEMDYERM
ncbi:hypothetical protein V865_007966 [Kwoniella europaea PYCC6329]|uniref:Uncharacterized protein n=1 Tax=Kwoniella europaea PYCC6329 TaxID=1423913 RepID=A0AAX4KU16_9TREE